MTDDDGLPIRRENARRRREGIGLAGMVIAFALAGLAIALPTTLGFATTDRILIGAAVIGTLSAILASTAARTRSEQKRLEARETRRDRHQRRRRTQMATLPFGGVGVVVLSMLALSRIVQGEGDAGDLMWAGLLPLFAWIVPLMVLGWDREGQRDRKWLEDELTREWRGRALSLGFLVLMGGMSGLYLVGLYRPEWMMIGFPLVLAGAAASVGLRFAWLDSRAECDND